MQTPIIDAGLATPSGMSSVGAPGQETPELIELRKRKIEADMEGGDTPSLYTILPEKKADRIGASMMGSTHTYDVPSAAPSGRRLVLISIKILLIDFQRAVYFKVRSFCVAIFLLDLIENLYWIMGQIYYCYIHLYLFALLLYG